MDKKLRDKCPICRKRGDLEKGSAFIFEHMCNGLKIKTLRRWSGNSGRIIHGDHTRDTVW